MADVYEIAEETAKAIEASRRFRASMTDDVEDEAREWPPIYHVCRALLAQKAVVEAADRLSEASRALVEDVDKNYHAGDGDDFFKGRKTQIAFDLEVNHVIASVRAMKEQTR